MVNFNCQMRVVTLFGLNHTKVRINDAPTSRGTEDIELQNPENCKTSVEKGTGLN